MCALKRLACAALALLFCLSALPIAAAGSANLFLACGDDTLYPLSSSPYYSGGSYYVPYSVFTAFGIHYSYYSEKSTAMVYMGVKLLLFDLANGTCYDDKDIPRGAAAIFRGGVVYLPVTVMCEQFGLKWSYISGNEYGDVLRIKNGAEVLSDSSFVSAAKSLMRAYALGAEQSPPPASVVTPAPTPPATPPGHEDITLYLSFLGLPDSGVLYQLEKAGYYACFFLSAADIQEDPDMVRRIYAEGHALGTLLETGAPDASYKAARSLIFESVHVCAVLAASADDGDDAYAYASEHGLAYKKTDILVKDGLDAAEKALSASASGAELRLICGADTQSVLTGLIEYLKSERYTVRPRLEV